jgi:hypothetical protein
MPTQFQAFNRQKQGVFESAFSKAVLKKARESYFSASREE